MSRKRRQLANYSDSAWGQQDRNDPISPRVHRWCFESAERTIIWPAFRLVSARNSCSRASVSFSCVRQKAARHTTHPRRDHNL